MKQFVTGAWVESESKPISLIKLKLDLSKEDFQTQKMILRLIVFLQDTVRCNQRLGQSSIYLSRRDLPLRRILVSKEKLLSVMRQYIKPILDYQGWTVSIDSLNYLGKKFDGIWISWD
ncbi:hypothetical protein ACLUW3_02030 [Limosilactobacillus reuteri subsp. suis]|uniref:hypothetical protein n=1 Tax=Limosilactobacillus reuteri TaxID=1598 RepID=UPI0039914102